MNKKLVVAIAASLVIANGSSVAMATGGSNDSSTTTSTVPRLRGSSSLTAAAQRAAQQAAQRARQESQKAQREAEAKYRLELARYLQTRQAIQTAFRTAMVNAQSDFKAARESATDRRAINIATRARLEAVQTATRTMNADLRALGAPPVRPTRP